MKGCSLLNARGIDKENIVLGISDEEVIQYCEKCSHHKCRLENLDGDEFYYRQAVYHEGREEVYQCLKCGEMETLTFYNGVLEPTLRFEQVGDKIYHVKNCGECRRVG